MALLGVDIGGTKIAVGIADDQGNLLDQDRFMVATTGSPGQALDRVAEMARALSARRQDSLRHIGIGSPGPFHDGTLDNPANLPGWHGVDLARSLSQRLGCPATLQNDATAAAIGEWMFGRGQHTQHLAYITVSTGVGAGFVLNGQPYGGPHGNAAEIGHIVLDPNGPQCNCGLTGCLESMASGTAMGRVGNQRRSESAYLSAEITAGTVIRAEDVIAGWHNGDAVCTEMVDDVARHLGHGLGILVNLVNPQRIVLGGGVMHAGEPLLEKIRHWTAVYSMPTLYRETELTLSGLGADTGLVGAVAVAMVGRRG